MKKILWVISVIMMAFTACKNAPERTSPDMAMYELRGNVKECIVTSRDSAIELYSDTLRFSPTGRLVHETSFSYSYNAVTDLLTSVTLGDDIVIPITITANDTGMVATGEAILMSDDHTLKYVYKQVRDNKGYITSVESQQYVKIGDDEFYPGDITTRVTYDWQNHRPLYQTIDGEQFDTVYRYEYDENGYLSTELAGGYDSSFWVATTTYRYVEFDSKGNWIERIATCESQTRNPETDAESLSQTTTIQHRTITYY